MLAPSHAQPRLYEAIHAHYVNHECFQKECPTHRPAGLRPGGQSDSGDESQGFDGIVSEGIAS
jgi:hypothetical protein